MKTFREHITEAKWQTGAKFKEAAKKIEAHGFVKVRKHSSPGMHYYEHPNGHTVNISDTQEGTPEIETSAPKGEFSHSHGTIDHKDLDSHLKKVSAIKEETLEEGKTADLHHMLTVEHGFEHTEKHMEGYRSPGAKGTDHYTPTGEFSPKDVHGILTKQGYTHLTRSKADSRVSLPAHTHYEKEQIGSRHSVQVHHKDGDVSHITAKYHRVRD